tara:strand:+ start:30678 stop:31100 length:423 start_codon:yes stop_codon:yes gene_type:complete
MRKYQQQHATYFEVGDTVHIVRRDHGSLTYVSMEAYRINKKHAGNGNLMVNGKQYSTNGWPVDSSDRTGRLEHFSEALVDEKTHRNLCIIAVNISRDLSLKRMQLEEPADVQALVDALRPFDFRNNEAEDFINSRAIGEN